MLRDSSRPGRSSKTNGHLRGPWRCGRLLCRAGYIRSSLIVQYFRETLGQPDRSPSSDCEHVTRFGDGKSHCFDTNG